MDERPSIQRAPLPGGDSPAGARGETLRNQAKAEASADQISYIESAPENQVQLSPRMEYLARRIGGCQTDEVMALVRRILFETSRLPRNY
jgi:hypothetical protein